MGKKLRAIDVYGGIGGWSAGLRLAGIQVVAAYEKWGPAIETYQKNLGDHVRYCDLRVFDFANLPNQVDVVVGSPPCTQFSYSNRGGNGDIADGLKDIKVFLSIVDYLQPRYWLMENVPRVKGILENELQSGGELSQYADWVKCIHVLDMSEFGLPQRRQRCIAGDYPEELLLSYRFTTERRTLGEVLAALQCDPVRDPTYRREINRSELTDHQTEPFLTHEEVRINGDNKVRHPVYNAMSFPDCKEKPSRTLTATCTKVSRESLIIEDSCKSRQFRRLTIRERASLQGFPCHYNFFGNSYTSKVKMVGNALPPLFSYYVGCALRNLKGKRVKAPSKLKVPNYALELPPNTPPQKSAGSFPIRRRFRAVIPYLHFKSGIRFELANHFDDYVPSWRVTFLCGTPKDIKKLELDEQMIGILRSLPECESIWDSLDEYCRSIKSELGESSSQQVQEVWTHRCIGVGPHHIADALGDLANRMMQEIPDKKAERLFDQIARLLVDLGRFEGKIPNARKIGGIRTAFLVGLVVGAWFNKTIQ